MHSKLRWVSVILVLGCAMFLSPKLRSQQGASSAKKPQAKPETEESVLEEKVEALRELYDRQVKMRELGTIRVEVDSTAEMDAGRDLYLAKAELAAVQGKTSEQIQSLQKAVEFADKAVSFYQERVKAGLLGIDSVTRAIIRRADTKLALIRAKKHAH